MSSPNRRAPRTRSASKALALLDVLIGMAVFALIAVIAVIAVGQFRQRAFETGAVSDARSVGLALESAATSSGAFPQGPDGVSAPGTGDRAITATLDSGAKKLGVITKGNRIKSYEYLPPTPEDGAGFRACVEHVENGKVDDAAAAADAHAIYDSRAGGVVASGDGNCSDALTALAAGAGGGAAADKYAAERARCEARGGELIIGPFPDDFGNGAIPFSAWSSDPDNPVYPWDLGLTQDEVEDRLLDVYGFGEEVIIDWWPTTAAEKAEFGYDSSFFFEPYLTRNGDYVNARIRQAGAETVCNFT